MQPPISATTKSVQMIEQYLRGRNRDSIASNLCIGTGTVSKIINKWKIGLDYPIADGELGLHRTWLIWGSMMKSSVNLSLEYMTVAKNRSPTRQSHVSSKAAYSSFLNLFLRGSFKNISNYRRVR